MPIITVQFYDYTFIADVLVYYPTEGFIASQRNISGFGLPKQEISVVFNGKGKVSHNLTSTFVSFLRDIEGGYFSKPQTRAVITGHYLHDNP